MVVRQCECMLFFFFKKGKKIKVTTGSLSSHKPKQHDTELPSKIWLTCTCDIFAS